MVEAGRYYPALSRFIPGVCRENPQSISMIKPNPFRVAKYVLSAHHLHQLPADSGIEIAIAGRSNAGKSSAINALTEQKALARTSKTPGRTQQIVIFEIGPERRIADLPGYGYARVSKSLKQHWQEELQAYFEQRQSLKGVILVMDIRHPLKAFDTRMLAWCDAVGIPCHILLTKADKLKRGPAQSTLLQVRKQIPETASAQVFSASNTLGMEALIELLSAWFGLTED